MNPQSNNFGPGMTGPYQFNSPYPSLNQAQGNNFNNYGSGNSVPMTSSCVSQPLMPGKMINNEDDILPREVPMSGEPALFMQRDLQRVIAKQWNCRGTIDTAYYNLDKPSQPVPSPDSNFKNEIFSRMDRLEEMIAGLSSPKSSGNSQNRNRRKDTDVKETEE